ncbi:MAG TPA: hypothetical protein VFX16_24000 [Pseudonocardiaceae bacterium]|nr:hypothetical protein [Pseudonocardiaceae bacterium]
MIGASLALLTVAACGAQTPSSTTGGGTLAIAPAAPSSAPAPVTTTPVVTAPMTVPTTAPAAGTTPPVIVPLPKPQHTPVPPAQVHNSGKSVPPTGVQATKDGKQVVFVVEQSGCQHITGQVTSQTSTSVAILVVTTITSHAGQVCPMIVRQVPVTVTLSAPLGSRTIVFSSVTRHN